MKSEIVYDDERGHGDTHVELRVFFFFAFLIFAFRPLPIARLQGLPLGEFVLNLRFSVSLRGQTRTRRVASW